MNNSHQIYNNYIINKINNDKKNINISNKENTKKKEEKENNKEINCQIKKEETSAIETISMQSTIRESEFYRREMEKISKYIKQCKKILLYNNLKIYSSLYK